MKKCILFLFVATSVAVNAQSVNVGFSTLAHLAKFEANYSLNKKIDVGAFYGLGLKSLAPHYFGATGKYQFPTSNTSKGTLGAYVGGSMGLAVSPSYEVLVIDGWNSYYETVKAEKKFCGSIFLGSEEYVGRKERLSSFQELHLGYMPNYLSYAMKGLFGALKGEGDVDPSKYSWWAFQVGFRIHIGR
jgi:hypothetical protein